MADTIRLTEEECEQIAGWIRAAIDYRAERWRATNDADCPRQMDLPAMYQALVKGTYWQELAGIGGTPLVTRPRNRILPKLRTKHEMLTTGETSLFLEPRAERFAEREEHFAALLQDTWQIEDWDSEVEAALWDAMASGCGYGVVEVGWEFRRGREHLIGDRGEPQVTAEAMPIIMVPGAEGELLMDQGLQEFESQEEAEAAAQQARIEEDQHVWGDPEVDDPYVERFSPRELIVDHNCRKWNLSDARFAFRLRYEYADRLKADERYSNTSEIKGSVYSIQSHTAGEVTSTLGSASDLPLVPLFDGYVFLMRGKVEHFVHVVFAEGYPKPLLVEPAPYVRDNGRPLFPENPYPYRILPDEVIDNDYWMPDSTIAQAKPIQLADDEAWEQLNDHRRKSNRQLLYPKGAMDVETAKAIEEGVDLAMHEVENSALLDQITALPIPNVQSEVYATMDTTDSEMSRALGVSEFAEAVIPDKKMLAREVDAVQQGGGARTTGAAKRYRRFREDVAMCVLVLLQRFADRAREYHYEEPDGRAYWGSVNMEDLRGRKASGELEEIGIQYRVKVNADNENPTNKQKDQQLKAQLLEMLAPFGQMPDPELPNRPVVNIKALLRMVLKALEVKDLSSVVPPAPSQDEVAQMQMQRARAAQMQMMAAAAGGPEAGPQAGPPEQML